MMSAEKFYLFVTPILNRVNESNPRKINFNIIVAAMFEIYTVKISRYCNLVYELDFP